MPNRLYRLTGKSNKLHLLNPQPVKILGRICRRRVDEQVLRRGRKQVCRDWNPACVRLA